VATVNEPHLLLPLLHSLRDDSIRATYGQHYAAQAIQDFCTYLPQGEAQYLQAIRDTVLRLYAEASPGGQHYFLDKTPKYHLLAEEIIDLFPDGKFLFLWRNPLAVVSSLIETWGDGSWNVFHFKIDLLQGLDNLIQTYSRHQDSVHAFRYEDAILEPEKTWAGVFNHLDLPFDPSVLSSFSQTRFRGRVRDPNSDAPDYQTIRTRPLEKWRTVLNNPLRRAWCRRYLKKIGPERLAIMGYDLDVLLGELDSAPLAMHHVLGDLYGIPVGEAYHVLELQLLKQKFRSWRRGQAIYMHT
jgi:hypothetical protein